ncbi:MAG: glycosyltransferase family 39 protein [Oceanospirillales bacterium]|nr:glycosyltransferase family 39 protein [Oceanospirillales bacterium]
MNRIRLDHPLWLLLFLSVGFVFNLWSVPLFDVDEGAFSEASRELLNSGIWSATYLDGEPRYDKPILTYWFQASSMALFGINELSLRLHSVICALLWAGAIYAFCREFIDRRSARAAVLIFSTTLLITLIGRAATADSLLNLLIALTFFDIYRYSCYRKPTHLLRVWLWLSLGMLTKGPVAAGIPLLVSMIWMFSLGQQKLWTRSIFSPWGWLILLSILAPWLVFVWREQGSGFFTGFLIEHNLNRFSATKEGHGGYWYYYLVLLPIVMLPWSGLMLGLFRRAKALWLRPFERLLIIWFAVVFVLVSLSQTQLPHYVLYGITPVVILFAKYRRVLARGRWQWLLSALPLALQIALVLYAAPLAESQNNLYQREMLAQAPEVFDLHYALLLAVAAGLTLMIGMLGLSQWKRLALAGLVQSATLFLLLLPALAELQQAPVKRAADVAQRMGVPFVAYRIHMPSFSLYRDAITERRAPQAGDYLFTRADRLDDLQHRFGPDAIDVFYREGGIVLAQVLPEDARHE